MMIVMVVWAVVSDVMRVLMVEVSDLDVVGLDEVEMGM